MKLIQIQILIHDEPLPLNQITGTLCKKIKKKQDKWG